MSGTLTVRDALPSPVVFVSPAPFLPRTAPPLPLRPDWRAVLLAPLLPAPEVPEEFCSPCADGQHATVEDGTCTCCGALLSDAPEMEHADVCPSAHYDDGDAES